MTKKIFLVLGNGFNEHFGMHMNYAAYHDYRKERFKDLYLNIESYARYFDDDIDFLLNPAKEHSDSFTVWDFYFVWPLEVDNQYMPFSAQDVNFELFYSDSFDSGFWVAVVDLLKNDKECTDEDLAKIVSLTFHACGSDENEKINLMRRKINFFAEFLKLKYKAIIRKCQKSKSKEDAYVGLYQCIYKELELFEQNFAEFVNHVKKTTDEQSRQESQQSFITRIKDIVDPKHEFKLQIINFNFNKLDDDVIYPCVYVHDTTEKPIFSGSWTNSTERDDLYSKELRYKYFFDKMYRRRSHNLKLYGDIINKNDENVFVFYGTSMSMLDVSEYTLMFNHRSDNNPIYIFYSKYNDNPDFVGDYLYNCYNNFFRVYYRFNCIDQFYHLVENGTISINEIK